MKFVYDLTTYGALLQFRLPGANTRSSLLCLVLSSHVDEHLKVQVLVLHGSMTKGLSWLVTDLQSRKSLVKFCNLLDLRKPICHDGFQLIFIYFCKILAIENDCIQLSR